MRNPHDVLIKPMVSEKSMDLLAERKYTFFVDKAANKIEIKHAVESLFNVKVEEVTTLILKGKIRTMGKFSGRRPDRKKAVVTLKEGYKLEIFESLH
ncbi:MAG: 50S ribosomal protein L23 [Clostridiales bacterium]|nr:50S ribosomal protein L23 [Clostridiales bacterium]